MKLKTFLAPSMPQAIQEVRQTLGPEAVIVSSQRLSGGGIKLVVAIDDKVLDSQIEQALLGSPQEQVLQHMQQVLEQGQTPMGFVQAVLNTARSFSDDKIKARLIQSFEKLLTFYPLSLKNTARTFMFMGLPGSGKTRMLVKVALQATLAHRPVAVMTLDGEKVGALEQLKTYTDVMKIPLIHPKNMAEALQICQQEQQKNTLILIDTPALSLQNDDIITQAITLKKSLPALEFLWVAGAETGALVLQRTAEVLEPLPCSRLFVSRLDICPFLGGILDVAWRFHIALGGYSQSPAVSHEMMPFTAGRLAQCFLTGGNDGL